MKRPNLSDAYNLIVWVFTGVLLFAWQQEWDKPATTFLAVLLLMFVALSITQAKVDQLRAMQREHEDLKRKCDRLEQDLFEERKQRRTWSI